MMSIIALGKCSNLQKRVHLLDRIGYNYYQTMLRQEGGMPSPCPDRKCGSIMNKYVLYAILIYLLLINLAGFLSMMIDKQKAKKSKWRIPERTLFLLAILGGSIGSNLGMQVFRHKTKHWYFVIGMPLILILQIVLVCYLIWGL